MYPDFNKPFILMTDGSAKGLGAVLAQKDENGRERVVAYASKSLVGAQTNYSATDLKLLAVVWAVEHFYKYLAYQCFILKTDHAAIPFLKKNLIKVEKGRLSRWIMRIQSYDFIVEYRPGKNNGNADALSRIPNG